jgi:hypothetical protein
MIQPEEKAKELIDKFSEELKYQIDEPRVLMNVSRYCSILCVKEIMAICPAADFGKIILTEEGELSFVEYWNQVLSHLQNNMK